MSNIYMKCSNKIEGETTDENHKNEIAVISYNHSVSQPTQPNRDTAGGGTVARALHGDFSVSKMIDKASPLLNQFCSSGETIEEIKISIYRSDGKKDILYFQYILKDVIVSNVSVGGGAGGLPSENVTFAYGEISWDYVQQENKGGAKSGHVKVSANLKENSVT